MYNLGFIIKKVKDNLTSDLVQNIFLSKAWSEIIKHIEKKIVWKNYFDIPQ